MKSSIPRLCAICETSFVQTAGEYEQKYCSRPCYKIARKQQQKQRSMRGQSCLVCNAPVRPNSSLQICSDRCRLEISVQRHAPGTDDCDIWIGGLSKEMYGQVRTAENPGVRGSHALSWVLINGAIPAGFHIGHRCHDEAAAAGLCPGGRACLHRRCCRPDHLYLQRPGENVAATPHALPTINSAKTHCPRGHALTPDNIVSRPNRPNSRECLTCHLEKGCERYRTVKTAAVALGLTVTAYTRQYGQSAATARKIISSHTPSPTSDKPEPPNT